MTALPTVPLPAQVEDLRPLLTGRACVVVGSAPLTTPAAVVAPDEFRIAVNGGIASLPEKRAQLWLLNSKDQDRPGSRTLHEMHRLMLSQANNTGTDHLLLLRGPKVASEAGTLQMLERRGARWLSWSLLDKPTKRWLEGQLCGRVDDDQPCSAGILAVALACYCEAASVRLVGFSFTAGYHYLPKMRPQSWWRNHVNADRRALKLLSQRYVPSGALVPNAAVAS